MVHFLEKLCIQYKLVEKYLNRTSHTKSILSNLFFSSHLECELVTECKTMIERQCKEEIEQVTEQLCEDVIETVCTYPERTKQINFQLAPSLWFNYFRPLFTIFLTII